jgi:hypothetical protein
MSTTPINATPTEALHRHLLEQLKAKSQTVEGGPWDGISVITNADLEAVFGEDLPPATGHGAEVMTPARVVVDAYCPRCHQPSTIALLITTELRVDSSGATLRLIGKSKPASHLCGQSALGLNGREDGQEDFGLEDIIGKGDDSEALAIGGRVQVVTEGSWDDPEVKTFTGTVTAFEDDDELGVLVDVAPDEGGPAESWRRELVRAIAETSTEEPDDDDAEAPTIEGPPPKRFEADDESGGYKPADDEPGDDLLPEAPEADDKPPKKN